MRKNTSLLILLLLLASFSLVACGTKGPLYIPEQRYPQGAQNTIIEQPLQMRDKLLAVQANTYQLACAS